ncbi:MAG: hypothetical protein ACRC1Y_04585, partial [Paraclostridium sp.]
RGDIMITTYYTVAQINGDYAILENNADDNQINVARALLPLEIDEGTQLIFENLEYTILY